MEWDEIGSCKGDDGRGAGLGTGARCRRGYDISKQTQELNRTGLLCKRPEIKAELKGSVAWKFDS